MGTQQEMALTTENRRDRDNRDDGNANQTDVAWRPSSAISVVVNAQVDAQVSNRWRGSV